MDNPRPASLIVFATLNFIYGAASLVFAILALLGTIASVVSPSISYVDSVSQNEAQLINVIALIGAVLGFVVGGLAIVSGVGLFKVATWARTWSVVYAVAALINGVIAFFLSVAAMLLTPGSHATVDASPILLVVGAGIIVATLKCLYPIILLFFIFSRSWKRAFVQSNPT